MTSAVIVSTARTPLAKSWKGSFNMTHGATLGGHVVKAAVERAGIDAAEVDDVIMGCATPEGATGSNIARQIALRAGLPITTSGMTVNRFCSSGLQAIAMASQRIIAGENDIVVAGGVESISCVQNEANRHMIHESWLVEHKPTIYWNMLQTAEQVAKRYKIERERMDRYGAASQQKATAARDAGKFEAEIAPVPGQLTGGAALAADEGIRRGGTLEALAALRPAFAEGGVVTAGNASQISDGSAAVLMMTSERAAALGLRPLARIHTAVLAAADPVVMLTAPLQATRKALTRSGLRLDDIGAFEVNEAFASVPLAWLADIAGGDAGVEKALNPNGGSIAMGHPLGASGARAMTAVVHHLRASGIRYALQTMCEGGGQANAVIVESL